jgi:hypothetical protein
VIWKTYGVFDHEDAARLLGVMLNRAQKWAEVGTPDPKRLRRSARPGEGFKLRWIYVHECGGERGFHSHVLMNLPKSQARAFRKWLAGTLERLTKSPGDGRSLRVICSNARDETSKVRRGWAWLRYLTKECDPCCKAMNTDGTYQPLRDILKPWPLRAASPVTCMKLTGVSKDIGQAARHGHTDFKSALCVGDDDRIFTGWELDEHRHRKVLEEILPTLSL